MLYSSAFRLGVVPSADRPRQPPLKQIERFLFLYVPGHGPAVAQLLSFEALIWQIHGGRMDQRPATEPYVAVQQVLILVLQAQAAINKWMTFPQFSPHRHISGMT